MDLLEHVVPIAFLLGHHGVPGDSFRGALDLLVVLVEDLHGLLIGDGILTVFEIDDVARVRQERRNVRGDDVLVLAEADDQRRAMLRGDDRAGLAAVDHDQRVVAFQFLEGSFDRLDEVAGCLLPVAGRGSWQLASGNGQRFQILFDEVGHNFRVRFGAELMSRRLKALLERQKVLDDAVVNDHDLAGAVAVRVRVVLIRLAVRGPARVAHAE